ncbi:MAG TPA: HEAT repeat domain-containing protein [Vicinamibacterales bacterium]|nr:HEAT repeat domain-containing protein [Vicinamibacterales bacterium]
MFRPIPASAVSFMLLASLAGQASAQPPRITNGRVTARPAGSPLAPSFRDLVASQTDVTWIGYSAPAVDGERTMCCFSSGSVQVSGSAIVSDGRACCAGCRLEPSDNRNLAAPPPQAAAGPVQLEASSRLSVLFRVVERQVERIRVFSNDCELDAGGRPVVWLENVQPADSVALLESFVAAGADRGSRVVDGAVSAIALHADTAADASLERMIAPSQPVAVRKKVTFWLGNARGARGLALLRSVLRDDPSMDVRRSAVFGVSQSREPDAFDVLATLARQDPEPRIRSEAVFWLAQHGDSRAQKVILEALDKDDSSEVRKKAVFALGQLRDNAGVEALIRIARSHADPATRGEAIFWLGQKAGAQASAAITERIAQDPDTEVKKRAVFALSQLPPDKGVPLLIEVARTHANPAVRKQAMFWLAQSKDKRALDFFAEVLSK